MPRLAADIATPDGVADVQFFTPQGAGPWPAVIVYTDAFGVRAASVATQPSSRRSRPCAPGPTPT